MTIEGLAAACAVVLVLSVGILKPVSLMRLRLARSVTNPDPLQAENLRVSEQADRYTNWVIAGLAIATAFLGCVYLFSRI